MPFVKEVINHSLIAKGKIARCLLSVPDDKLLRLAAMHYGKNSSADRACYTDLCTVDLRQIQYLCQTCELNMFKIIPSVDEIEKQNVLPNDFSLKVFTDVFYDYLRDLRIRLGLTYRTFNMKYQIKHQELLYPETRHIPLLTTFYKCDYYFKKPFGCTFSDNVDRCLEKFFNSN